MDNEEIKNSLKKGLTSEPKYIPIWYKYNKEGSLLYEDMMRNSSYYYLPASEIAVLKEHCEDIVNELPKPSALVDLGSSSGLKTRTLIDAFLRKQQTLQYMPVDISEEFLQESSEILANIYGDRLDTTPVPGVFEQGIVESGKIEKAKLIVSFSTLQTYTYERQMEYLTFFAKHMKDQDRLLISFDITLDKEQVLAAYFDPLGIAQKLYLNSVIRLNNDMQSNIDLKKFEMESDFILQTSTDTTSYFTCWIRSLEEQSYYIPGLQLEVKFSKNERLYFHEGESLSCKYTMDQIKTLAQKSGLNVIKHWEDSEKHSLVACLKLPGV